MVKQEAPVGAVLSGGRPVRWAGGPSGRWPGCGIKCSHKLTVTAVLIYYMRCLLVNVRVRMRKTGGGEGGGRGEGYAVFDFEYACVT